VVAEPRFNPNRVMVRCVAPDPASSLAISVRELERRPGSWRRVECTVAAPERLGTDVIGVPDAADIELDLMLESVMEGVLVTGTVRALARGACVRCLDEVGVAVEAPVQELFVYPERGQAAVQSGDEEPTEQVLAGERVDLGPAVRDAIVLSLPFQPVCREDCPGLCTQCGVPLAEDPAHQHRSVDPRWAALGSLFDQGEES